MTGEVRGPSGSIPVDVQPQASGQYMLSFIPKTEGKNIPPINYVYRQ